MRLKRQFAFVAMVAILAISVLAFGLHSVNALQQEANASPNAIFIADPNGEEYVGYQQEPVETAQHSYAEAEAGESAHYLEYTQNNYHPSTIDLTDFVFETIIFGRSWDGCHSGTVDFTDEMFTYVFRVLDRHGNLIGTAGPFSNISSEDELYELFATHTQKIITSFFDYR